jgi:hypothetical protein
MHGTCLCDTYCCIYGFYTQGSYYTAAHREDSAHHNTEM